MAPGSDGLSDTFHGLLLRLRGRTGLTQRDMAARIGVHVHSLQGWEAGNNHPGVTSLRALVAAVLQAGGFTAGREQIEATALWAAALREAPRFRTPFDRVWFAGLMSGLHAPAPDHLVPEPAPPLPEAAPPLHTRMAPGETPRHSWGEAPDVAGFLGRAADRQLLTQWVVEEQCRVVAVCGLGGLGKSLLATRLAHDLAPSFDRVIWRSLQNAPAYGEWLADVLGLLDPDAAPVPGGEPAQLRRLLELLSEARCLLVLDNFETVLEAGGLRLAYRAGFERYGTLLRQFGETAHRSCLVVTSREEPPELGPLQGTRGRVRALELDGLSVADGRALLSGKQLHGDDPAWQTLIMRCGGNGLALKVVGETIRELFDGSISEYLAYASESSGVLAGGVRDVLERQLGRLPPVELDLLRWLAIEREPVGLMEIGADLGPLVRRDTTLEAVEGLRRRSLLERAAGRSTFTLHAVVLEYVTAQLIEELDQALTRGELDQLCRWPVVKATAREHVRRSQERLIAGPLLERLVAQRGSTEATEQLLLGLLDRLRALPLAAQGYGPGSLVNLLRLLCGNLREIDLSGLTIRQAYLQDVEAQDASLVGAHLTEAVFGEACDYPARVALSADGAYVAAGTATGEVCVWRIRDRTLLARVQGHSSGMLSVALSDGGRLVAAAGYDGAVRLWETATGRLMFMLEGHTGPVYSVVLTSDGRHIASGSTDQSVRLWDARSGAHLSTLTGHSGGVRGVALSQDGQLVASGGYDGTIRLWDAATGQLRATLLGHTGGVWSVALSADGTLLASSGQDQTVRLWATDDGRALTTLRGHTGQVWSVALSHDGKFVASGSADGEVRLWDTADGRSLPPARGHTGQVWSVSLCGAGRTVASGSDDGTLRLSEVTGAQPQPLATLRGRTGGVWGLALGAAGDLAASGGHDGAVRLWSVLDGRLRATLSGHSGGVWSVALSRDGQLAVSGSHDETVRVWDTASGDTIRTLSGHRGGVWSVALSADGLQAASGGVDGAVRLWETASGRLLLHLEAHEGGVRGVALSEDGRLAASGGFNGTVRLWDTASGRLLMTLEGHEGGVRGVSLRGDGALVASGGYDGTVRLWETASGRLVRVLQGQRGGVWGVALRRDAQCVASSGYDGTIYVWDTATGRLLRTMQGHHGGVWGLALTDDGSLAVSGGIDGTVRVWALSSGANVRTFRDDRRYERMDVTGLTGVTEAQRQALFALGALEQPIGRPTVHPGQGERLDPAQTPDDQEQAAPEQVSCRGFA